MRFSNIKGLILFISLLLPLIARPAIHYVDVDSTNAVSPYLDWATAAATIQDAENASSAGDEIVVTNGVYSTGVTANSRISIVRAKFVHSVNGPEVTAIEGYQPPATTNGTGAIRCINLCCGATIAGFTLTNGATPAAGSGVEGSPGAAGIVSNCVFVSNVATFGGAADYVTLINCRLFGNVARNSGGGSRFCTLINCGISNNVAGSGGGCHGGTNINCVLFGNTSGGGGGAAASVLNNCILISNRVSGLGAEGGGAAGCNLINCLVIGNTATFRGGGASGGYLVNCTVISNTASSSGGGFSYVAAGSNPQGINTILYFNSAPNGPNFADTGFLNACCIPEITTYSQFVVTNPPLFVSAASGDFRLQPLSPCINAGRNSGVGNDTDLEGNPRISGGTVDIGAYEFQNPLSLISYGWLLNHGLPTDGSADFMDSDGDGMNNWQEWVTNTDPTNSLSYLHMLAPDGANNAAGVTFHWQSTGIMYFLQRSTNLAGPFDTFATNFYAGVGVATYRDASATNTATYFYRVGVQH
jgi:hypothetical protein